MRVEDRITCPVCHGPARLWPMGTIKRHRDYVSGEPCRGAGRRLERRSPAVPIECHLCHHEVEGELTVRVRLGGSVELVCYRCMERADPEEGE